MLTLAAAVCPDMIRMTAHKPTEDGSCEWTRLSRCPTDNLVVCLTNSNSLVAYLSDRLAAYLAGRPGGLQQRITSNITM